MISANGQAAAIASPANRSRMLRAVGAHAAGLRPRRRPRTGAAQAHDRGHASPSTAARSRRAFTQIDSSGDGAITITCRPSPTTSRRSGSVSRSTRRRSAAPCWRAPGDPGVGGAGFVVLLVTTILWFIRKPQTPPRPRICRAARRATSSGACDGKAEVDARQRRVDRRAPRRACRARRSGHGSVRRALVPARLRPRPRRAAPPGWARAAR